MIQIQNYFLKSWILFLQVGQIVCHKNRSEEHTSELQSQSNLVCRLLLEKKKKLRNQLEGVPRVTRPSKHNRDPVDLYVLEINVIIGRGHSIPVVRAFDDRVSKIECQIIQ